VIAVRLWRLLQAALGATPSDPPASGDLQKGARGHRGAMQSHERPLAFTYLGRLSSGLGFALLGFDGAVNGVGGLALLGLDAFATRV
jgi:hypothetical protein